MQKARSIARNFVWSSIRKTHFYRLFDLWFGGMGTILSLHRVLPKAELSTFPQNRELEFDKDAFEFLIQNLLKRKFVFYSMDQVHQAFHHSHRRFVALTFDDGYKDNFEVVLPILRKYAIPATFYITTDMLDRKLPLWWYGLEKKLQNHPGKEKAYDEMRSLFFKTPVDQYAGLIAAWESEGIVDYSLTDKLAMTWDELKACSLDPHVTIGAHSLSHRPLAKLSLLEAQDEILGCKNRLEKELGKTIHHFAYPFGSEDTCGQREFDLVKEVGYLTAVTTRSGNLFQEHATHLLKLPRISIRGGVEEAWNQVDEKISGLPLAQARQWKRVVA